MSLRLGALHDALLDPGNAEKAQKAAEEVAGYHTRFNAIERDLAVLKWMTGTIIAITLGLLWLMLRMSDTLAAVAAKVGVP